MASVDPNTKARSLKGPGGGLWRAAVSVAAPDVAAAEAALGEGAVAVSAFGIEGGSQWRVEALFEAPPSRAGLKMALADLGALEIEPVAPADWVRLAQSRHPTMRAGRYYIHGSHDSAPPPAGSLALRIDAGAAFGTGLHESTRGCLLALDRLARGRRFRRPLDLGCGTGILAMAMTLTWRVPVMAADVDPVAVAVARENARRNGLGGWVRAMVSEGMATREVAERGPYDLIAANILARPLAKLAPALASHLATGGAVVLSGLLVSQEAQVTAAYRAQGLRLARRHRLGEWSTLVMGGV